VTIAGSDEQVVPTGRGRSCLYHVRIDEAPQPAHETGLGGTWRAENVENGIGTARAQVGEQVRDGEREVRVRRIEEWPQRLDLTATLGIRERQHPISADEPHRRSIDHAPARGGDAHGLPTIIAEVDVDFSLVISDAHAHVALD